MAALVTIKDGDIKGAREKLESGEEYYKFLGIPYARPPVGNRRFKAPEELRRWHGLRDASKPTSPSVAIGPNNKLIGSEDCLYLNVFTSALPTPTPALKPVVVLIHGGGFDQGVCTTKLPLHFLREQIVVVSLTYRLGVLGFISFKDPSIGAPGNAGFKDIVMALKWVQQNIANFNGDPKNVTLLGQGTGATAAHLLIVSPMAKGLFHRVILQSGTALVGFDKKAALTPNCYKVAEHLGSCSMDQGEIYEFLNRQTPEKLLKGYTSVNDYVRNKFERFVGPVIENTREEPMFLPADPEELYAKGLINQVPIIIGFNNMDGMIYAAKGHEDKLLTPHFIDKELVVPRELNLAPGSEASVKLADEIVEQYYGIETPSGRNIDKYSKLQTDLKFVIPIKKTISLHQSTSQCPIYLYRFAFESRINRNKLQYGLTVPGVGHGDELVYLIPDENADPVPVGSVEEKTQHRIVRLWTNFVKSGDPNKPEPDALLTSSWAPVGRGLLNHINIDRNMSWPEYQPEAKRMQFWDKVYDAHSKPLSGVVSDKIAPTAAMSNLNITDKGVRS